LGNCTLVKLLLRKIPLEVAAWGNAFGKLPKIV
jgi:hypothetical protein